MKQQPGIRSQISRYSLRALIVLVGVAAILFTTARPLFNWLNSTPLSQSVSQMNDRIAGVANGEDGPLSEKAVLAAIESGLTRGNIPEHVATVLKSIAERNRLPINANLAHDVYYKGSTPGNPPIECFGVSLVISNKPSGEFALPICEIENGFLSK